MTPYKYGVYTWGAHTAKPTTACLQRDLESPTKVMVAWREMMHLYLLGLPVPLS